MRNEADVEALPTGVPEERLIEALEGRDREIPVKAALGALAREQTPAAARGMARLAANRRAPAEQRVTAVRALGRVASPERLQMLVPLLRDRDPSVVGAAAQALGRSGDARALSALEAIAPLPPEPHGRSIRFARQLLSYRLGAGSELLRRPRESALLPVGPGAQEIDVDDAPPELAKRAQEDARRDLPALELDAERARRLRCWGLELMLVPTEQAATPDAVRELNDRNAIPAVVLRRWDCPERWGLSLYVFTHPEAGELALIAVRPDGTVVGGGRADRDDTRRGFQLRSVRSGRFPAVDLDGVFSPQDGFVLERALSAGQVRRPGTRTPQRAA